MLDTLFKRAGLVVSSPFLLIGSLIIGFVWGRLEKELRALKEYLVKTWKEV